MRFVSKCVLYVFSFGYCGKRGLDYGFCISDIFSIGRVDMYIKYLVLRGILDGGGMRINRV